MLRTSGSSNEEEKVLRQYRSPEFQSVLRKARDGKTTFAEFDLLWSFLNDSYLITDCTEPADRRQAFFECFENEFSSITNKPLLGWILYPIAIPIAYGVHRVDIWESPKTWTNAIFGYDFDDHPIANFAMRLLFAFLVAAIIVYIPIVLWVGWVSWRDAYRYGSWATLSNPQLREQLIKASAEMPELIRVICRERSRLCELAIDQIPKRSFASNRIGKRTDGHQLRFVLSITNELELRLAPRVASESAGIHDLIDELMEASAIPESVAKQARFVATIRNQLVHEYAFLRTDNLPEFEKAASVVAAWVSPGDRLAPDARNKLLEQQLATVVDAEKCISEILTHRFIVDGVGLVQRANQAKLLRDDLRKRICMFAKERNKLVHTLVPIGPPQFEKLSAETQSLLNDLQEPSAFDTQDGGRLHDVLRCLEKKK
ncbi:MAG TPA: hypothetical protein DDW52_11780 [Planctomycetaceae bacterium]|nr:hypothetical protein [Planctomycetaceae bacterium]